MYSRLSLPALLCAAALLHGQQDETDADAIMARVAANQDRAQAERSHYVYAQHARVASRKGGTLLCEEITDSRIIPSAGGSGQQLLKLNGRVLIKRKYLAYTTLHTSAPVPDDLDIDIGDDDRNLVETLRAGLLNSKSRDGISAQLFPLTSKNQADYAFQIAGRARTNGRDVFHIEFRPRQKNGYGWKGDAYIDTAAYQPVVVSTSMARKVPFAVRTLLGTNAPGLGFTVTYAPVADGIWFPASFGTEFQLHLLFFYHRDITMNIENRDFEKTQVDSAIVATGDAVPEKR